MDLVMLGAFGDFCSKMSGMLKIVGFVLTIFKIIIPVIIVIYGIIDLGKAVTASKDDEIKKAVKQLGYRLAAGVMIFFVPTLILMVFGWISDYNGLMSDDQFQICHDCLLKPNSGNCSGEGLTAGDSE